MFFVFSRRGFAGKRLIFPRRYDKMKKKRKETNAMELQIDPVSPEYRQLMAYYRCALMEVETKFRVLDEELSLKYDRNPIETIKTRLKSPESIEEKLRRLGCPLTAESIEQNLEDVAGVRVITSFPSDIFVLSEALKKQDDVRVLKVKDYVHTPKESGYRSLHLVIEIPIFLKEQKRRMRVEIQFRSIAMDWWASVEHKIRYKKSVDLSDEAILELTKCARISAELDQRMEDIFRSVE